MEFCILDEESVDKDGDLLTDAWSGQSTFIFMPSKRGIGTELLQKSLPCIPPRFHVDHFGLWTSGSTGQPKLVIGSKERATLLARTLHLLQESSEIEETIVTLPLTYSYAFVNQWVWAATFQRLLTRTLGLARPELLLDTFGKATDAKLCLVGVQVPLLVQHFAGHVFPGIRRIHFAGGRFPQEKLGELDDLFPNAEVFNNYGCAEAMPRLTLRRARATADPRDIGTPLPGIRLRTDDHAELLFQSPYSAVGYVADGRWCPIAPDDWIPTGDLAEQTEGGSWRLLGRRGDVFKRFGEKISLPVLSATVGQVWRGQAVFYRDVDPSGEDGYVLVLSPRPREEEVREILLSFRRSHSRAHWPLRIESIDSLPSLATTKFDVLAIRNSDAKTIHWRQRL